MTVQVKTLFCVHLIKQYFKHYQISLSLIKFRHPLSSSGCLGLKEPSSEARETQGSDEKAHTKPG